MTDTSCFDALIADEMPEWIWATADIDVSAQIIDVYAQSEPEGFVDTPTKYVRADLMGWRDIESAPRDGTFVMLARVYDFEGETISVVTFGHWLEGYGDGPDEMGVLSGWHDHHYSEFDPGRDFGNPDYYREPAQPTHWMPLPQPPEGE